MIEWGQEALRLYESGLSYQEIADKLGKSRSGVNQAIALARGGEHAAKVKAMKKRNQRVYRGDIPRRAEAAASTIKVLSDLGNFEEAAFELRKVGFELRRSS